MDQYVYTNYTKLAGNIVEFLTDEMFTIISFFHGGDPLGGSCLLNDLEKQSKL